MYISISLLFKCVVVVGVVVVVVVVGIVMLLLVVVFSIDSVIDCFQNV